MRLLQADCWTTCLREEGVERIPGAHCTSSSQPPLSSPRFRGRTGYVHLTDFLLRHSTAWFFASRSRSAPGIVHDVLWYYRKLNLLAQAPAPKSEEQARAIRDANGLQFEYRQTGYGPGDEARAAVRGGDARSGDALPKEEVVTWVR